MHALKQGLIATNQQALTPSFSAIGPNTYLGAHDFLKMLGVAFLVHLLVFGIASLFPNDEVTNIPVRALSFKLGDQDRVAAYAPVRNTAAQPVAAPVMQASSERVAPTPLPRKPVPAPVKPQKIVPAEQPVPQPRVVSQPVIAPLPTLPQTTPPTPAIAEQPQQYVREVGQAPAGLPSTGPLLGTPEGAIGGAGTENTQTERMAETIRQRYEQQISSWIQQHKLYPAGAGGQHGRVVIRMRIDRSGVVRYYALEQSSGNAAIDNAAIDMVRRANPVPAVPLNYPAGNLIEFLIPITFQAPQ